MKYLLFLLLPVFSFGQTINDRPIDSLQHKYIIVKGFMNLTQTKVKRIEVDIGQRIDVNFWGKQDNATLKDENGQEIEMNTLVDALNFFADYGYYLDQTLVIGEGGSAHYEYILRRSE